MKQRIHGKGFVRVFIGIGAGYKIKNEFGKFAFSGKAIELIAVFNKAEHRFGYGLFRKVDQNPFIGFFRY